MVLELDDGDQLFGAVAGNRNRRAPTPGDLVDRRLDVVGRVVTPVDDQQILDSSDDEQLVARDEAEISGSEPGFFGSAVRGRQKLCAKSTFGLFRPAPVAEGHVVTLRPDL